VRPVKLEMQGLRSYRKKTLIDFSAPLCQAALREGACESATRLL
jgi:hypothetical protein